MTKNALARQPGKSVLPQMVWAWRRVRELVENNTPLEEAMNLAWGEAKKKQWNSNPT